MKKIRIGNITSLEMFKSQRSPMAPARKVIPDRKKESSKKACRGKINVSRG